MKDIKPLPPRDIVKECLPEHDHFMAPAWIGLLRYASTSDEIVKSFEKDTGLKFEFPNGIEGMISESTGHTEDLIFKFAHWVTKNLWGDTQNADS